MAMHSVVYSFDPSTGIIANLNRDVLNLDGFVNYTIAQYLEDRASEGVSVVSAEGSTYRFSDGSVQVLTQQIEPCEDPDFAADPDSCTVWANLYHSKLHNVVYAKLFLSQQGADDQAHQSHIVFRRHRFGRKAFPLDLPASLSQEVAPCMS